MDNLEWSGLDPARSRLRVLVARVDQEIRAIRSSAPEAEHSLAQAWQALTDALALGAEPALRGCPHCQRGILREATRCRYCMQPSEAQRGAS